MNLRLKNFNYENVLETLSIFNDEDKLKKAVSELKNLVGCVWFFEQGDITHKYDVKGISMEMIVEFEKHSQLLEKDYMKCLSIIDSVYEENKKYLNN